MGLVSHIFAARCYGVECHTRCYGLERHLSQPSVPWRGQAKMNFNNGRNDGRRP